MTQYWSLEIEFGADSPGEAVDLIENLLKTHTPEELFEGGYLNVTHEEDDEEDDDPQCVCGVWRSEHALCGCGEWQNAATATPAYDPWNIEYTMADE